MNFKKTCFSVLCVLLLFSSCFCSVVHAETTENREALDFIYGNRENLTGEAKRIILIARIVNPEKMKEYEGKFIWDDDGLLAYKNANTAVLHEIISNIDTNGDIILGDLNKNRKVDVADARIALRLAVGLDNSPPDGITFEMVDVSLNNKIEVEDARMILNAAINDGGIESLYRREIMNKTANK